MNEFFQCPSHLYGVFVIGIFMMIITGIAYTIIGEAALPAVGSVGGLLGFGWLLWVLWHFVFRHADCERKGNFEGDFRNPFS